MAELDCVTKGLIEFIDHFVDPSDLNDDPACGAIEKQAMMDLMTREFITQHVPDYDTIVEDVCALMGDKFTDFLLQEVDIPLCQPPNISITGPNVVVVGDPVLYTATVILNCIPIDEFILTWNAYQPTTPTSSSSSGSSTQPIINVISHSSSSSGDVLEYEVEVVFQEPGGGVVTANGGAGAGSPETGSSGSDVFSPGSGCTLSLINIAANLVVSVIADIL